MLPVPLKGFSDALRLTDSHSTALALAMSPMIHPLINATYIEDSSIRKVSFMMHGSD